MHAILVRRVAPLIGRLFEPPSAASRLLRSVALVGGVTFIAAVLTLLVKL